ncbi:hypothetical protein SCUP234_02081 [Seiridium cupressi]
MPRDVIFSTLPDRLPKAGLVWPHAKNRHRIVTPAVDALIGRNFKAHGVPWKTIRTRMADPFYSGLIIFRQLKISARDNVEDFLQKVHTCNEWTATLPFPVFQMLMCRVIEAQMLWNQDKRAPLDRKDHSQLAKVVRSFRQALDVYPKNDDTEEDNVSLFLGHTWPTDEECTTLVEHWEASMSQDQVLALGRDAEQKREEMSSWVKNGFLDMSDIAVTIEEFDSGRIRMGDMVDALEEAAEDGPEHMEGDSDEELMIFT